MEPFLFSRKQRILQREERTLKNLEREQLRTFKEINSSLELVKRRLENRQEWLKGLREALVIERESLQKAQAEFNILLNEAIAETDQAEEHTETEYQMLDKQLNEMQVQKEIAAEREEATDLPEKDDVKIFIPSTARRDPDTVAAEDIKVQWYHPGQQGFSL